MLLAGLLGALAHFGPAESVESVSRPGATSSLSEVPTVRPSGCKARPGLGTQYIPAISDPIFGDGIGHSDSCLHLCSNAGRSCPSLSARRNSTWTRVTKQNNLQYCRFCMRCTGRVRTLRWHDDASECGYCPCDFSHAALCSTTEKKAARCIVRTACTGDDTGLKSSRAASMREQCCKWRCPEVNCTHAIRPVAQPDVVQTESTSAEGSCHLARLPAEDDVVPLMQVLTDRSIYGRSSRQTSKSTKADLPAPIGTRAISPDGIARWASPIADVAGGGAWRRGAVSQNVTRGVTYPYMRFMPAAGVPTEADGVAAEGVMPTHSTSLLLVAFLLSMPAALGAWLLFVSGKPWYRDAVDGALSRVEHSLCFCFFSMFANHVIFASVIPELQTWTRNMAASQRYSGFLFGSWMAATLFGYVLLWYMNRKQEGWSTKMMRPLLICSSCLSLAGTVVVLMCTNRPASSFSISVFAAGRIFAGLGAGMSLASTRVFSMWITPAAEQPMCNSRYTFYVSVGVGLGPLAGSTLTCLVALLCGPLQYSTDPVCGMHISLCLVLFLGAYRFPSPSELDAEGADEIRGGAPPSVGCEDDAFEASARRPRWVICCCVFISLSRAVAISGLEVATASILENGYGWSTVHVGWIVGSSYLLCIPQRLLHERCKHFLSINYWIRFGVATSIVGSVLFFESVAALLASGSPGRVGVLILADVLLFPSMQLINGLIEGTANKHSLPHGSAFALTNVVLYLKFATNFVGFLSGPIMADHQIEQGGQDSYAGQQLILSILCGLIFEIGVVPFDHEPALPGGGGRTPQKHFSGEKGEN